MIIRPNPDFSKKEINSPIWRVTIMVYYYILNFRRYT